MRGLSKKSTIGQDHRILFTLEFEEDFHEIKPREYMKYLLIGIGSLAGLGACILVIGFLLPIEVTASRTAELKASPAIVFQTVTDVEKQTSWRKDVKTVKVQPNRDSWTEETIDGVLIEFKARRKEPPHRFEIEFVSNQGFSGSWVGIFTESPKGTIVQITETVKIPNPIFRVISRAFNLTDKLVDTYLSQLKASVEN